MKVVAVVSPPDNYYRTGGTFLVELGAHELSVLTGSSEHKWCVGAEASISDEWKVLSALRTNREALAGKAEALRALAGLIELLDPEIRRLLLPPKDDVSAAP